MQLASAGPIPPSSLKHTWSAVLSALLASVLAASRSQAVGCPTSTMTFFSTISTQAAVMDTLCCAPGLPYADGHFNLLSDTLSLSVYPQFGSASGEVAATERYRIVGAAPGTPVAFTLRMPISASLDAIWSDVHATSSGTAKLEVDGVVVGQTSQLRDCPGLEGCTSTGSLTPGPTAALSMAAEQEFVVVTRLSASVTGNIVDPGIASLHAGLHFDDLPAGIAVVSCHDDTIGTLAVDSGTLGGALRFLSAGANPTSGPIPVAFFAPHEGPVMLHLMDIAGRTVERARVEVFAAGPQAAILGRGRRLAPGTYVVQITQGAASRSKPVTVVW